MPQVVSGIGMVVVAAAIAMALLRRAAAASTRASIAGGADAERSYVVKEPDSLAALTGHELLTRAAAQIAWLVGLTVLIHLIGMLPAAFVFIFAYTLVEGRMRTAHAALLALAYAAAMFLLFDRILHMPWPNALIGDLWPQLRDIMGLRLV